MWSIQLQQATDLPPGRCFLFPNLRYDSGTNNIRGWPRSTVEQECWPICLFSSARGGTQVAWTGVAGFLLTVELAVMVTLVVLVSRGDIWQ